MRTHKHQSRRHTTEWREKKMFPTRCKRWWNWETDWHASVLWGFLLFLSVGARISSKNFHERRENRRRESCSRVRKGYAKPYYSRVIVSSPLRSNNNFEPLPWLGAWTWRALTKMETDVEYPSQREKGATTKFSVACGILLITHQRIAKQASRGNYIWKFMILFLPKLMNFTFLPASLWVCALHLQNSA